MHRRGELVDLGGKISQPLVSDAGTVHNGTNHVVATVCASTLGAWLELVVGLCVQKAEQTAATIVPRATHKALSWVFRRIRHLGFQGAFTPRASVSVVPGDKLSSPKRTCSHGTPC